MFRGLLIGVIPCLSLLALLGEAARLGHAQDSPDDEWGAGAITFGEPAGDRFPYVVNVVFRENAQSPWRTMCSGSLISPTVVLTVDHCNDFLEGRLRNPFDDVSNYQPMEVSDDCSHCPRCESLCPNYGVSLDSVLTASSVVIGATPFSHPTGRFVSATSTFNDVGVLVLEEPVEHIEPACLAEENFSELFDLQGHSFRNVGYGGTRTTRPGQPDVSTMGVRRVATTQFVRMTAQNIVSTQDDNGGTCFGDSGGPALFEDSDLILAVTSAGEGPDCISGSNIPQRVDIPSVREFLADFVDLDAPCARPFEHPRPEFVLDAVEVFEGQEVRFDGSGSTAAEGAEIVSYEWSFGDGEEAHGVSVRHTFDRSGLYTVRVTVRDDVGRRLSKKSRVAVRPASEDVSPWQGEDIGEPELPGASHLQDDCLVVAGAEGTVSGRQDQFQFVHREINGDFQLTTRVDAWRPESIRSQLGLMIRESIDPAARHATVLLEAGTDGVWRHQFRRRETGSTRTAFHDVYEERDVWLRVERRGSILSGSISLDGFQWLEPDTVELPGLAAQVNAGVASSWVVSEEGGSSSRATLCDLAVVPLKRSPTFLRGDCDDDGTACSGVNDALTLLNWLFLGRAKPSCLRACDPDASGDLEIADALYGLSFCFQGTAPPVDPYPECGARTDATLGCESSTCE